jgi:LysM repeat protein
MHRFLACLFFLSMISACSGNTDSIAVTVPAIPYQTHTPSETPTLIPPQPEIRPSTPTAFIYIVLQSDTLIGIAGRYGVTLDALLAANPGVQPSVLPVGTSLIIPTGNELPGESTPTPAVAPLKQARCWPELDGGLWCFAVVQNEFAEPLENLSAQFTLLDPNGQDLASLISFALLNTLPPGKSIPLAVHFPPPALTSESGARGAAGMTPRVQLLSALRILPGDLRYLPVFLENSLVSIDSTGVTAQVGGRVMLTGTGTANTLWVLATAYDTPGNVVGLRRWESSTPLTAETPVTFNFVVYSLGPEIARVELLAEARP